MSYSAAAINAIHYNRIMAITDEEERKAFIDNARAEYASGIDVFKLASENVFSEVQQVLPRASEEAVHRDYFVLE